MATNLGPSQNPPTYGTLAAVGVTVTFEDLIYGIVHEGLSMSEDLESSLAAFILAVIAVAFGWLTQRFTIPGVNIHRRDNA